MGKQKNKKNDNKPTSEGEGGASDVSGTQSTLSFPFAGSTDVQFIGSQDTVLSPVLMGNKRTRYNDGHPRSEEEFRDTMNTILAEVLSLQESHEGHGAIVDALKAEINTMKEKIAALEQRVHTVTEENEILTTMYENQSNDHASLVEEVAKQATKSKQSYAKVASYAKDAQGKASSLKSDLKKQQVSKPKKKRPSKPAKKQPPSFCITAPHGANAADIEARIVAQGGIGIRSVTTTTSGNFRVFHKGDESATPEKIVQCITALGEGYGELDTNEWFKRVFYMSRATTPDNPEEIRAKLEEANGWNLSYTPHIMRSKDGVERNGRMAVVVRFNSKEDEEKASKSYAFGFNESLTASRPYTNKPRNTPRHE